MIYTRKQQDIMNTSKSTRCDKKFLAPYASMRFIELKSLSVNHLISFKDNGTMKSMQSCLIAYVKHF